MRWSRSAPLYMYRSRCCADTALDQASSSATIKIERAPRRPSTFTPCKGLEGIADTQRCLRDVCAALRIGICPVVILGRFAVRQLARDQVQKCLTIECIGDAEIDHRAFKARRTAVDAVRQCTCAFAADYVLHGRPPRSAPARFPADGPIRVFIALEFRARPLAALLIFQLRDITH